MLFLDDEWVGIVMILLLVEEEKCEFSELVVLGIINDSISVNSEELFLMFLLLELLMERFFIDCVFLVVEFIV